MGFELHVTDHLGTVLPAQFYEARRSDHPESDAYYRLCIALLEDAIRLYRSRGMESIEVQETTDQRSRRKLRSRLYCESRDWLFDGQSDQIMSSNWVCQALGIEPEFLRAGLRDWKGKLARRSMLGRPMPISMAFRRRRRKPATGSLQSQQAVVSDG